MSIYGVAQKSLDTGCLTCNFQCQGTYAQPCMISTYTFLFFWEKPWTNAIEVISVSLPSRCNHLLEYAPGGGGSECRQLIAKFLMSWLQRSYNLTTIKAMYWVEMETQSGFRSFTDYFAIFYSETNTHYSFLQGIFHNLILNGIVQWTSIYPYNLAYLIDNCPVISFRLGIWACTVLHHTSIYEWFP